MSRSFLTPLGGRRAAAAASALVAACAWVATSAPAHAAASVSVDADGRGAVIDSTYSTTITVSGRGFDSIKKGHGGIYVWFGTVNGDWRPSQGGVSGKNYVYVPDSEAKDNAGFQRYVAFPGSNTSSAANGGTMKADGSWSTQLIVPGPTFEAVGRNGGVTRVDCRKVTCGVITIGAHGVRNGSNETFTPVKLADLGQQDTQPDTPTTPTPSTGADGTPGKTSAPTAPTTPGTSKQDGARPNADAPVELTVDHASARPGGALSFTVANVTPGEQFTVVLDDGRVAAGPFAAGDDGRAAGVVGLPVDLEAGTHTLRLFGASKEGTLNFGVQAADDASTVEEDTDLAPRIFTGVAAALFVLALVFTVLQGVRSRRGRP